MMKLNKIIAALLICALVVLLCGCYNPGTVAKSGETEITAGQYLMHQFLAATDLLGKDGNPSNLADLFKTEIGGVSAEEYIHNDTLARIKDAIFVQNEFNRLKLSFDPVDEYQMSYYISYYWNNTYKTMMEANGVSEKSYHDIMMGEERAALLFKTYYGENGEFKVEDAELMKHYDDTFAKSYVMTLPAKDPVGVDLTAEQKALISAAAEAICADVNDGAKLGEAIVKHYPEVQRSLGYPDTAVVTEQTAGNFYTIRTLSVADASTSYPEELIKGILDLEMDSCAVINVKGVTYVALRAAAFEDAEGFKELRDQALESLKRDEFDKYIREKSASVELTVDQKAADYYSVYNIKGF